MGNTVTIDQLRRQAWWNVAVGFVVWMLIVVMPATLMPLLYVPIMDEMGWSRGQVTAFSSFKFGIGAIIAFFMGHIIDRVGLNIVMLISFTATGLSIASMLTINSLPSYYLAAGVLGASMMGAITGIKVLISRWFSARLGTAVGLALAGGGVSGLLIPPLATKLFEVLGWRWTTVILSSTIFVILIPLYLWRARTTPAKFGYTVEQLDPAKDMPNKIPQNLKAQPDFRGLLAMRSFWIVFGAHVIIGAVDHAMLDHLPLFIARDANLGLMVAAWGFSIITASGNLGKIGFGWIYDRYSIKAVALCYASMAVGIALAFPVTGLFTLVIFALARGFSHGGVMVEIPICAKHIFGLRSLSKTIAVFSAANSLGGAVATGGVGFMHDAMHSYTAAFILLMILSLIAAAMLYFQEPKYWARWQGTENKKSATSAS